MGILDRIILTLYTISLAIVSFIFVLASLEYRYPLEQLLGYLNTSSGRWVIGVVSLVFFAVSVRLIFFAFRRGGPGQALVHQNALGDVRISLDAVEGLVRRVARQIKGVREMKAHVVSGDSGLVIDLTGTISPEVSIPEVSEEIQNNVKSYVRRVVGAEVLEVRLRVESISNEGRRSRLD